MADQHRRERSGIDKDISIEHAPFAILVLAEDVTVVDVNPAGERLFGKSAQMLLGLRFGDIFSCGNADRGGQCGSTEACRMCPMRLAVKTVLDSGQPVHELEIRLEPVEPLQNPSSVFLASILPSSSEGKKGQVWAILSDVTERKLAESALRESEERYRLLSDVTMEGILIHKGGMLLDANYSVARLFGYKPGELRGQNVIARVVHEEDLPVVLANVGKEYAEPYVVRCLRKNGEVFHAEFEARNFVLHGEEVRVVAVRDITERRLAEQARERLQEQLRQAQKMESLGSLAGGVAHDFNNLLQAMSGNIQMLLRNREDDAVVEKRLQTVAGAIDRAAYLVRQLLLFSRKANLRRESVDLRQSVENAVAMLERTIPRMVSFELRLDHELPSIHADPIQVEQVLLNLAANAVDAMSGCGILTITAGVAQLSPRQADERGVRPGPYVLLRVADTGAGMDNATREQMFDPFFTTKEPGKGTGLGLASVYGIVTSHEGAITCDSSPGKGSSFTIYWPVSAEQDLHRIEAPLPDQQPGAGSETILVVDDEAEIRNLAREALIDFHYQVLLAKNGEEALALFSGEAEAIDLIILDMSMPGMGGYQCLQELRRLDPEVPILISSGYAGEGTVQEARRAGASGFIGKPYQLMELLTTIRALLDEPKRDRLA